MEVVKFKIAKDLFFQIEPSIRDKAEIQEVTEDGYDYSDDEIWTELKKASTKAYLKRKEREYNIRHNNL